MSSSGFQPQNTAGFDTKLGQEQYPHAHQPEVQLEKSKMEFVGSLKISLVLCLLCLLMGSARVFARCRIRISPVVDALNDFLGLSLWALQTGRLLSDEGMYQAYVRAAAPTTYQDLTSSQATEPGYCQFASESLAFSMLIILMYGIKLVASASLSRPNADDEKSSLGFMAMETGLEKVKLWEDEPLSPVLAFYPSATE
ncbi:hypothetical protein HIM_02847 [Hirsutella minnesotensis 3608]|nr:hypothetical protein HIM_02847 [Hirsutella minnesotensis 3608]